MRRALCSTTTPYGAALKRADAAGRKEVKCRPDKATPGNTPGPGGSAGGSPLSIFHGRSGCKQPRNVLADGPTFHSRVPVDDITGTRTTRGQEPRCAVDETQIAAKGEFLILVGAGSGRN
ncbi:predicted protein [Coccidioides posadasii str. Silveira]|uniref:Predicted protein n=1 Tax=Coccidioides posadasii (strain RMSCC 757 / Silveira) TaxID=443226 RepID=E9CZ18_COCPS|nr:predicted protein [Coccidioides posadasii str. Silveira]